ncbi:MAG: hypothetical protein HUJ91_07330 [Bacteroidales bacterium]|nr:hypothetical protein [Bacteroidales bacterium]
MNLRTIKKDIEFVTNEFLSDCLTMAEYKGNEKDAEIKALIEAGLKLAGETFDKVNAYPKENTRAYFNDVNKCLYEGFDKLYQDLSALVK